MPLTLLDFSRLMRVRARTLSEIHHERKKKVAEIVAEYLIDHTPVDTSKAVSNWTISYGEPVFTVQSALFPGVRGSTEWQSRDGTLNKIRSLLYKTKPGKPIYITNSVDYIGDLNNGKSIQAPNGFLEGALLVGRLAARATK